MRQISKTINHFLRFATATIFAVFALTAHAQDDSGTLNGIQSLGVSSAAGGKMVLKVGLKNAPASLPAGFTINNPPRIALDFPNTANELGKSVQEFDAENIRSANIVQAGNRTRLVINLNQMLTYDTRIEGNDLLITLYGPSSAVATASPSRFAEAMPSAQNHSLRDVDFHRGKNGEGRIQVDLSDPNVGIDIKEQGKKLIVDFMKTSLPRNLQRKLDVTDFGTPVEGIDTFAQGDGVRMIIEPKGLWEHAAYQTDNKFIVEVKPIVVDQGRLAAGGRPVYTGEKLTLNFQDITVREALQVIADFTDLNIVISDTVRGNLTLRLKDVPWDQALDIILQSKGLDMRRNGNVIQIAPRDELASKEKLDLTAKQDISDLEEMRTESFTLSYQKGKDVAAMLSNKDQRILSKRGSAVVDEHTNTVFVQDTPERLEEARKLIQQIDVPVRQVMIEARFVEASDTFNRLLGARLGFTAQGTAGNGAFNVGVGQMAGNATINTANMPDASALGGVATTLTLFNPAATRTLQLELAASEQDGTTKSIASPRIVTANQQKAIIKSGVQIPYTIAGTNGGPPTTAFKDAVLSLQVTPQITPDDNINMDLVVNRDTVGASYGGIPSINNKQITTQVKVENGGTVVIGGVYTQDVVNGTSKAPLLGDIPILGWLFKYKNVVDNKSELLVFITPKILNDSLNLR
jgi:type IV pilus assembly protein PilQ